MSDVSMSLNHRSYEISSIKLNLVNFTSDEIWDCFIVHEINKLSLVISIKRIISYQYGLNILPSQPGPSYFLSENALVSANSDWREVSITLLDGKDTGLMGALSATLMTHLSTRSGLLVHASLVEIDGKGIMFLGPSGIGKTTQAELWAKYRDALIINGDMVFVAYREGVYRGYGSPWHGSSPYCLNRNVPIVGMVVLEQDCENSIVQLSGITCVERVMQNVFMPTWYKEGVDGVLDTLDGLLSHVNVYLLKCRPDEEAVDLVASVLDM